MDEEKDWDLILTDAGSTYNPALVVLRDKGYWLYFVPDPRPEIAGDYYAIKKRRVFIAMDPVRLLGLVALWEHLGDDWYGQEREGVLGEVESIAFAEDDFQALDDAGFARLVDYLRPLFDRFGVRLPDGITRKALADLVRGLSEPELGGELDK